MTLGEKIKALRLSREMTLEELANKTGLNKSTILRYEKGDTEKFPSSLIKPFADALRTTPDYLMGWDNETQPKAVPDVDKLAARTVNGAHLPAHPTDKMVYVMPDNSMMLECIKKNAVLKIKTSTPKNGDIVLVSLKNEMLVRRYTKLDNGTVLLEAANPKYKTSFTTEAELGTAPNQIYGIVKSVTFDL